MAPTLNVTLVSECIMDGTADRIMAAKREAARNRNMMAKDMFKGYSFKGTDTGFFIWLNLPEHWSGKVFELKAREAGINVFCAEKFAVGGTAAPNALRISLTGPSTISELNKGIAAIKGLMEGELIELGPML
jgi:DNA-binding transcriptional MocR family regulator